MTSQGHVTTASLNKHIRKIKERYFLSAYSSKSSAHPSLKLLTVNWGTLSRMMWKFDHDQKNSHRGINKRFGVEECWFYIRLFCTHNAAMLPAGISLVKSWHTDVTLAPNRADEYIASMSSVVHVVGAQEPKIKSVIFWMKTSSIVIVAKTTGSWLVEDKMSLRKFSTQ